MSKALKWWSGLIVVLAVTSGGAGVPAQPAPARGAEPPAVESTVRVEGLGGDVEVCFDAYDIPRIYGGSMEDVFRAIGYLHASGRMWQMELFRRLAAGRLAEIQGEEGLASDILMRRLGLRRSSQEALDQHLLGEDVERWLEAYAAGVNARMDAYRKEGWPTAFRAAGFEPEPWAPVDSVTWMKYMGWDQGGTRDDLWLGMMVEKLGAATVNELWPLDRPYEVSTIPAEGALGAPMGRNARAGRSADAGFTGRGPSGDMVALERRGTPLSSEAINRLVSLGQSERPGWMPERTAFGSNNWVVSGKKSASGRALFANDPHLGFSIPMMWYAAQLTAPGLSVTGVTFPGVPFVIIGHNEHIAWGFTNLQSDAVDYFVETLGEGGHAGQYLHRGEWKPLVEREEVFKVAGKAEPVRMTIRETVHGPLDHVGSQWIATQWTGLGTTREVRGLALLNVAKGWEDFLEALGYIDVPALNVAYADREGNIAMAPWGRLPVRASGLGRVPVDGASGDFDWVGWIPREELPLALNPERGFIASANGRPTPVGYAHHLGWMWDPSYRSRRITDLLAGAEDLTFEDMQRFQFDHHDKAAEVFVPVLLGALKEEPAEVNGAAALATEQAAKAMLAAWDFGCTPQAVAPTIFARWINVYRAMVWDDEWATRGIVQPAGSWGFTGDNRREPVLEVLEYLTRENPESVWFDDRRTPERETRDEILRRSFTQAIRELTATLGMNPEAWAWGRQNVLALEPLMPTAFARRGGQALYGGPFTLNPGSDGRPVSGGASWRQVVEFTTPIRSAGVYPGGQSENFASPHYDDLIALWATGSGVELALETAKSAREAQALRKLRLLRD